MHTCDVHADVNFKANLPKALGPFISRLPWFASSGCRNVYEALKTEYAMLTHQQYSVLFLRRLSSAQVPKNLRKAAKKPSTT